jgi:hypothetical protein
MKMRVRNAHIGIVVSAVILIGGLWPARNSEDAVAVLGMVAFFTGLGVCFGLTYRDERVRDKDGQRSS